MFYNFTTKLPRTDEDLCTIYWPRYKVVHNTSKGVDNEVESVGKFCSFYNYLNRNKIRKLLCQNEPINQKSEKPSEFTVS